MHQLLFLMICTCWSSSFLAMKWVEPALGPIGTAWVRIISGAGVLLVGYLVIRRRQQAQSVTFGRKDIGPLLFIGIVGTAWPFMIQPYLVSAYGSGFIGMTVGFVPLVTVIAQIPLLGRWPTRRELIGVSGGLCCLGLLFADGLQRAVPLSGMLLAASVPLSYAVSNTYLRRRYPDSSPLTVTLATLLTAAVVIAPLLVSEQRGGQQGELWQLVVGIIILGPIATGLALYAFVHLVQSRGPLFAGMVTYVIPAGAVLIGWLAGEQVSSLQMVILIGIITSVVLVQAKSGAGNREKFETS